jgi:hypothetical protein
MAEEQDPENILDSEGLSPAVAAAIAELLGQGEEKETIYNTGLTPGPRPGSSIVSTKKIEDILYTYRNLPTDQIAAYQLALQKMGYKTEPTGKLNTATQMREYSRGILDVVKQYSDLLETSDPALRSQLPTLAQFFNESAIQGGAGKASTSVLESVYLTAEADAIQYYNNLYRTYTGEVADAKEAKRFAQRLRKLEQDNVQRQTTTTKDGVTKTVVTKSGFDDLDREELALSFIEPKLTDQNIITMGGQIGANFRAIDGLLKAYNVNLTDPNLKKTYLIDSLKSKNGLEDVSNRIKNLASIQYPALAPYFQQGYSPSEVFGGFLNTKARLYGTPNLSPNPWNDRDIVAIAQRDKLPSYQEWESLLLNAPEAEYSPGMRQRAAEYADQIPALLGLRTGGGGLRITGI